MGSLVVLPTLGALAFLFATREQPIPIAVVPWVILIALVELLPVATWGGVTVSVGYPLIMAVAFTFAPEVAALVALVSASDPREFKREVTVLRALFNRSSIALAVLAASGVFHAVSSVHAPLLEMFAAALLAIVVDYAINLGLVTTGVCLLYGYRPLHVVKELLGRGQEFVVSYLGLGALGASLARLYTVKGFGFGAVLTVLAPLLFARQMFLRSQALEEAHKELKDREQVLRTLSNAMAEERADERQKIAAYLHDDLAQVLFRLSIQVDVARKLLDKGDLVETGEQLEKIRESKQDTSDRIRALIRDLHRSPLGAKGLAESLESFTDEVGKDSGVHFHLDVADVAMPAPIALLIYHIAREGLMNALKHAQATDFWIAVRGDEAFLELELRDNGRRLRHDDARTGGALRHDDDARTRADRWWNVRGLQRSRSRDDDHGPFPHLAASAGTANCAVRCRAGSRHEPRAPTSRDTRDRRTDGRRHARNRPRVMTFPNHAFAL